MPLQHSHEYEQQPAHLRTADTVASQDISQDISHETLQPVSLEDVPRYDPAAVKQIIALAEQMQSHHRQTLTPSDIEALGHEIGVEPQFVRRALAQMAQTRTATETSMPQRAGRQIGIAETMVTEVNVKPFVLTLTRKQQRLLAVPVVLPIHYAK